MSANVKSLGVTLSGPGDWREFQDGNRVFYAYHQIISVKDSDWPVTALDAYEALEQLGARGATNREYNLIADQDPGIAEQMRYNFIPAGVLMGVSQYGRNKYNGTLIECPRFDIIQGRPAVSGEEREVILPDQGWFEIGEILWREGGLPSKTYNRPPDGPCAYFIPRIGRKMAILRGRNYHTGERDRQRREFAFTIMHELPDRIHKLGLLAVSDKDPKDWLGKD